MSLEKYDGLMKGDDIGERARGDTLHAGSRQIASMSSSLVLLLLQPTMLLSCKIEGRRCFVVLVDVVWISLATLLLRALAVITLGVCRG